MTSLNAPTQSESCVPNKQTGQSPPKTTLSGPNTSRQWLMVGAKVSAFQPAWARATIPESLQTVLGEAASADMSSFQPTEVCQNGLPFGSLPGFGASMATITGSWHCEGNDAILVLGRVYLSDTRTWGLCLCPSHLTL